MKPADSPWSAYWRDEAAAQTGATLTGLPEQLRAMLDAVWHDLAKSLMSRARVLDLATGGGVVLDQLRSVRPDLRLIGIDSVPQLPERPGMRLIGGIELEDLPFEAGSFDAITSRFGIEYGDLAGGAIEAARVLRPGGVMRMLSHHESSRIVQHNRERGRALAWAAHDSGWVAKAQNFAQTRQAISLPTPPSFRSAAAEGRALFPGQSAAWEFLTGLCQILDLVPPDQSVAAIAHLLAKGEGELARLDALAAAACGSDRLGVITEGLARGGVVMKEPRIMAEPDGTPLAWLIVGTKQA